MGSCVAGSEVAEVAEVAEVRKAKPCDLLA